MLDTAKSYCRDCGDSPAASCWIQPKATAATVVIRLLHRAGYCQRLLPRLWRFPCCIVLDTAKGYCRDCGDSPAASCWIQPKATAATAVIHLLHRAVYSQRLLPRLWRFTCCIVLDTAKGYWIQPKATAATAVIRLLHRVGYCQRLLPRLWRFTCCIVLDTAKGYCCDCCIVLYTAKGYCRDCGDSPAASCWILPKATTATVAIHLLHRVGYCQRLLPRLR